MALGIVKQTEMYNRSAVLLSLGGTRNGGMDMTKRIADILPTEYALVVGTVSRIELMTVLAPSLFEDFYILSCRL
jgi:hypothetical protein